MAGGGVWQYDQQVGAVGVGGAFAGLVLTVLAVVGRRDLDHRWGRTATALAVTGLVLAVASAVPVPPGGPEDLDGHHGPRAASVVGRRRGRQRPREGGLSLIHISRPPRPD